MFSFYVSRYEKYFEQRMNEIFEIQIKLRYTNVRPRRKGPCYWFDMSEVKIFYICKIGKYSMADLGGKKNFPSQKKLNFSLDSWT